MTLKNNLSDLPSIPAALQREFIKRRKKNVSYSLRAYAQFLEIDQSFLSKLLNGKRALTPTLEEKLAMKLGYSKSILRKSKAKSEPATPFVQLTEDEYEIISSWYHFAILELMKTKGFRPSCEFVASQLGIHVQEAKDAVDRLVRLGFVKVGEKRWTLISKNHVWTKSEFTSEARRRLQIELAQKSMETLEQVPFKLREHGSLTVAIDSSRLPEFKAKIIQTLKELSDYFQPDQKNLDAVYQVTLSLFPIQSSVVQKSKGEN